MKEAYQPLYGQFLGKRNLNIGCANNYDTDFINIDMNPEVKPDVVHNIRHLPWPFEDNSIDFILASHVFEHIPKDEFLPIVAECHRVLKVGGKLLGITPYGSSDDAWENPMHVNVFTENTWQYCLPETYEGETTGNGATQGAPIRPWKVAWFMLVPYGEYREDPEAEWKIRHLRNIVKECHALMEKI